MLHNQQLLLDYCEKFYGYGSWNSKIWFVGMEEGGGGSATESAIKQRLDLWQTGKAKDLENAPEFYGKLEYAENWFGPQPQIQWTWRQLIRVLHYGKKREVTENQVKRYQVDQWGRPESVGKNQSLVLADGVENTKLQLDFSKTGEPAIVSLVGGKK